MLGKIKTVFIVICLIISRTSYTMEQKPSTTTDKENLWNSMEMQVNSWTDALGMPIDPKIKEAVIILNLLGYKTEGSCEGHLNQGYAFPWVSISIIDDKVLGSLIKKRNDCLNSIEAEQENMNKSETTSNNPRLNLLRKKICKLTDKIDTVSDIKLRSLKDFIHKFYIKHTVSDDRKLMLSKFVEYDYWLMSAGAEQQVTRDEETKLKKLHNYQEEINLFTKFLKDYYWSDFNS